MDKIGENNQTRALSPLFRQLLRLKVWTVERFRLSERQVTLIWAALIGVLGALASEVFRKASEILHYLATGSELGIISSFSRLPWWQRLAVPTVGGLLAGDSIRAECARHHLDGRHVGRRSLLRR